MAKLLDDKQLRVRAIMTLGAIGPAAAKTVPELKKLRSERDEETMWAAYANWQVTGEARKTSSSSKSCSAPISTSKRSTSSAKWAAHAKDLLPGLVGIYREDNNAAFSPSCRRRHQKDRPRSREEAGNAPTPPSPMEIDDAKV